MNKTRKIIEKAITFIEDDIKSKISLDDIALNCNVSKYHHFSSKNKGSFYIFGWIY